VDTRYAITLARARDVPALAAIERAADRLLEDLLPASLLGETTDEHELREAQIGGRLWVALADDTPVGFALVELLDADRPHLEELDVHPDHGQRGIGSALVRAVLAWLEASRHGELTLTTFREVPWNMPFYARLGFEEIPAAEIPPELAAVVRDEEAHGLDPALRTVMRRRVNP